MNYLAAEVFLIVRVEFSFYHKEALEFCLQILQHA